MPIRIIIQRVKEANLYNVGKIGPGIMLYLSILKNTSENEIESFIDKQFLSAKLKDLKTVIELKWDILIVPQASIGGKLKKNRFQYHSLIRKEVGERFYEKFCEGVRKRYKEMDLDEEKIVCGVFGKIQALEMKSEGPYTHIIEK